MAFLLTAAVIVLASVAVGSLISHILACLIFRRRENPENCFDQVPAKFTDTREDLIAIAVADVPRLTRNFLKLPLIHYPLEPDGIKCVAQSGFGPKIPLTEGYEVFKNSYCVAENSLRAQIRTRPPGELEIRFVHHQEFGWHGWSVNS